MKLRLGIGLVLIFLVSSLGFTPREVDKYKCMVQLINYTGEGAYLVVSVLDENDKYVKTLHILGDDEEWYPDLEKWYAFQETKNERLDGITGATIAGGERSIFAFEIDRQYINSNHKLRFETAVEDQKYVMDDVFLTLTEEELTAKQ